MIRGVALAWVLVLTVVPIASAQENPAIEHARRVFDRLRAEQFDEVAAEFNSKMAAALTVARLRDTWARLGQQVGAFKAYLDQRIGGSPPGTTGVILGCQFEKIALNVMIAFDGENKIGGLHFVPRPSAEPAATPASTRFKEEPVTVGSGEWALPGTLSLPVDRIAAAVVLVHGSGPNDRDETLGPNKPFRDLAWGLADRGIAVLRYEKRTRQHGARLGAVRNFTVRDETIDDAVLAAALLRTRDRIDPKRVFVLGHSLGGMLAPRIAAQDPAVAGLVIMAGTTRPLLEVARQQLTYLASLNPGSPAPDDGIAMLRGAAPESYWKDLDAYHPAEVAAKLTVPMLILQGERDYQVTLADLEGWRTALAGHPNVTIKSYPALNHLFMPGEGKSTPAEYQRPDHIPDAVLDDIARWLRER